MGVRKPSTASQADAHSDPCPAPPDPTESLLGAARPLTLSALGLRLRGGQGGWVCGWLLLLPSLSSGGPCLGHPHRAWWLEAS